MDMYRAAVIDDEEVIVNGLVRTMPWAKYGCEVTATAADGLAALEMLRREKPDLLFTDIQMPGADGLAVIAAVRSEFPDMQVTILSGYPNFEYAQRAISLGVVRYVLKPSRFAELEDALKAMTENLDALARERAAAPPRRGAPARRMRRHPAPAPKRPRISSCTTRSRTSAPIMRKSSRCWTWPTTSM
jgi:YesN/AraC family two-component response regulator